MVVIEIFKQVIRKSLIDSEKSKRMKKWIALGTITMFLLLVGYFFKQSWNLHDQYFTIVGFFSIQIFVFFRIDQWSRPEWQSQIALVKITVRLISSLIFITVLIYTVDNSNKLVIQFIIIYLIYMIFEIVGSLTNLRRN